MSMLISPACSQRYMDDITTACSDSSLIAEWQGRSRASGSADVNEASLFQWASIALEAELVTLSPP